MDRFKYGIRPVAVFAGIIGALQAALWMALCITGIVAYYCHMSLEDLPVALGSVFELTFFKVYFSGPCEQVLPEEVNFEVLDELSVMTPIAVHGIIWAYLLLSFFWLISSITLITNVRYVYVKYANIFLFIWITLTTCVSILDLCIGILFGLDYGIFRTAALEVELAGISVQTAHVVLLAAQAAAGVMMGVAFRGFLLWIVNVSLVGYFFTRTLEITDHNRTTDNSGGMDNFGYGGDKPSDPYGFSNQPRAPAPLWFNQSDIRPVSSYPTIPHVETRNRPAPAPPVMPSVDRRRPDDDVVVMRRNDNVVREINDRNSLNVTRRNEPNPDYSPPMPRNNNPYDRRTMMKGSRF